MTDANGEVYQHEAQLTFNQNTEGLTESVTLFQGGQKIVGKKLGDGK